MGFVAVVGKLLVHKEVHLEKQQCWAHLFLGKLNDQHEVAEVSAKFTLINSCTSLTVNSVLECQQTAVLVISWHLVFNRFLTHTTCRSQKWISESAHVVLPKWAETISNIWSISNFLNFKRYVFCHAKVFVDHRRYFITLIALIYCIGLVICYSRYLTNREGHSWPVKIKGVLVLVLLFSNRTYVMVPLLTGNLRQIRYSVITTWTGW